MLLKPGPLHGREAQEVDVARRLAALAHPARLRVLRLLVIAGPQGLTPGAISDEFGMPPATLSFHLRELAAAGLVTQQREGRFLIYRADDDPMGGLLSYLSEHCCTAAGARQAHAPSPHLHR